MFASLKNKNKNVTHMLHDQVASCGLRFAALTLSISLMKMPLSIMIYNSHRIMKLHFHCVASILICMVLPSTYSETLKLVNNEIVHDAHKISCIDQQPRV